MTEINSLTEYVNQYFPSKYLTGDDVAGAHVPVVIKEYKLEQVKNPKKGTTQTRLLLYFDGKDKGLIVAKTRANELKILFGDNPKDLIGKEIMLYTKKEKSFGQVKNIIHIRGKDVVPDYVPGEDAVEDETVDIANIPF